MEENIKKLLEIYVRKGNVSDKTFENDPAARDMFLRKEGLKDLYDKYAQTERLIEQNSDPDRVQYLTGQLADTADEIRETVRKRLAKEGIDVYAIYGKPVSDERAMELFLDQLEEHGISREQARELGLDNLKDLLNGEKEFTLSMDDNERNRKFCEENDFETETRDGRIHARASVHAAEGVAVEDTKETREILDRENIRYIRMAMDWNPDGYFGEEKYRKHVLFSPFTWQSPVNEAANLLSHAKGMLLSSQFGANANKMKWIVALGLLPGVHPVWAVAAFIVMKKTGQFRDRGIVRHEPPSMFEKGALKKGLTVYKEENRNGRNEGFYLYMHKGNLCRVPSHDVVVPREIKGIRLSVAQREQFRKGELVQLEDRNGQMHYVRIDMKKPDLFREYYLAMKSDRMPTAKPGTDSSDKEKLEYIAKTGARGVRDIYGTSFLNVERDAFLSKYGLKFTFDSIQSNEERLRSSMLQTPEQRTSAEHEIGKLDAALRSKAYDESLKAGKKQGMSR